MTRANIVVILLAVVTTSAAIEIFSPEVDQYFPHNYHNHAIHYSNDEDSDHHRTYTIHRKHWQKL